jgi:hypothetical protein
LAACAKDAEIDFNTAEKQLIRMIRELNYGEIRVIVQDSKPVRVEEIEKSVVLEQDKKQ